jgi:prevent-host-death family protein
MTASSLLAEPTRVEEPRAVQDYSAVLSRVATEGRPVIVSRNGTDLAAVISLAHLELLREIVARQEVEELAKQIDFERLLKTNRPPQQWFDDDDNPFIPEEEPAR